MNRIELQMKKDTFFGKLKKVELVFHDRQTGENHAIDISDVDFLLMRYMVDAMNLYIDHKDFHIAEDSDYLQGTALKVTHSKAIYKDHAHLVATVSKVDFLEMLDELIHVRR
ncbi:hypothetical protein bcgnr5390_11300 [Bacillus luti]|nr:hypothetical protein BC2903_29610 [Bacillus cereus]